MVLTAIDAERLFVQAHRLYEALQEAVREYRKHESITRVTLMHAEEAIADYLGKHAGIDSDIAAYLEGRGATPKGRDKRGWYVYCLVKTGFFRSTPVVIRMQPQKDEAVELRVTMEGQTHRNVAWRAGEAIVWLGQLLG